MDILELRNIHLFKNREFLDWIKTIENLHCISMREIKSLIF